MNKSDRDYVSWYTNILKSYSKLFHFVEPGGRGLVSNSCPTLETLCTVAHQASLSMGFPRQEYWSGLPFPSPEDLPNPASSKLVFTTGALYFIISLVSASVRVLSSFF